MRSRVLVRSWDYRQRRHTRGVWFRLRRLLTDACEVYAISSEEAEALIAEGHQGEPVGLELEPKKIILLVPAVRAGRLQTMRPLAVRLSAELLAAGCLVLVPFEPQTSGLVRSK
jgi:hypothetical protein